MATTVPHSPDDRPPTAVERWRSSLELAIQLAQEAMPDAHATIDEARRLVSTGQLELLADGTTARLRHPDGRQPWLINGQCPCPEGDTWCCHRTGRALLRKTWELCQDADKVPGSVVPSGDEAPSEATLADVEVEVPSRFLVAIHGKHFTLYSGLRFLAGQRGLLSIAVEPITITPEFAVFKATARFKDGSTWTEIGDATPKNCSKQIAPAFIRMAATRAKARCLREALGIETVSVEELAD
jgi:hypothetical protein